MASASAASAAKVSQYGTGNAHHHADVNNIGLNNVNAQGALLTGKIQGSVVNANVTNITYVSSNSSTAKANSPSSPTNYSNYDFYNCWKNVDADTKDILIKNKLSLSYFWNKTVSVAFLVNPLGVALADAETACDFFNWAKEKLLPEIQSLIEEESSTRADIQNEEVSALAKLERQIQAERKVKEERKAKYVEWMTENLLRKEPSRRVDIQNEEGFALGKLKHQQMEVLIIESFVNSSTISHEREDIELKCRDAVAVAANTAEKKEKANKHFEEAKKALELAECEDEAAHATEKEVLKSKQQIVHKQEAVSKHVVEVESFASFLTSNKQVEDTRNMTREIIAKLDTQGSSESFAKRVKEEVERKAKEEEERKASLFKAIPTGTTDWRSPTKTETKTEKKQTTRTSAPSPATTRNNAAASNNTAASSSSASGGTTTTVWRCVKCQKKKELAGDHLKGKNEVYSECWPCARKTKFTLSQRREGDDAPNQGGHAAGAPPKTTTTTSAAVPAATSETKTTAIPPASTTAFGSGSTSSNATAPASSSTGEKSSFGSTSTSTAKQEETTPAPKSSQQQEKPKQQETSSSSSKTQPFVVPSVPAVAPKGVSIFLEEPAEEATPAMKFGFGGGGGNTTTSTSNNNANASSSSSSSTKSVFGYSSSSTGSGFGSSTTKTEEKKETTAPATCHAGPAKTTTTASDVTTSSETKTEQAEASTTSDVPAFSNNQSEFTPSGSIRASVRRWGGRNFAGGGRKFTTGRR